VKFYQLIKSFKFTWDLQKSTQDCLVSGCGIPKIESDSTSQKLYKCHRLWEHFRDNNPTWQIF